MLETNPNNLRDPKEPKRYGVLDAYRYIAAIGVTLYHFERHYQPYLPHPTAYLERMNLCVDFFFVLSGFVLMHTYGGGVDTLAGFGRFLRKRLARIYPLHAVMTLVFVAASLTFVRLGVPLRDPASFDISVAPAQLLLVHAWGFNVPMSLNFPSWSISAEFFLYLLFPLFALLVLRLGAARALLAAYALGLCMTLIWSRLGLGDWTDATADFGNLRATPSFIAGMAVQRLITRGPPLRTSWPAAHGGALVIAALMLAGAPNLAIVALFPLAIALIASAERSGAPSRLGRGVWLKLGDASYGVYLIHTVVVMACLLLMRKFSSFTQAECIGAALAGSAVTTGLAMLSYRWFENPARKYFGGGTAAIRSAPKPAAQEA